MSYGERLAAYGHEPIQTKSKPSIDTRPSVNILTVPLEYEKDARLNKLIVRRIEGKLPGFALSLNSGTHGREDTSIEVNWRISERAEHTLERGTVTSLLVASPRGALKDGTRTIVYDHGGEAIDPNRVVPVNLDDAISELTPAQLHGKTYRDIHRAAIEDNRGNEQNLKVKPPYPGLVIDFHTEDETDSNREDVVPYVRIDPTDDDEMLGFTIYCAEVMGLPWVIDYAEDEYQKEGLYGSLTGALVHHKEKDKRIPGITIELGPEGRVDVQFLRYGIAAVENLMIHFEMIKSAEYEGDWYHHPQRQLQELEDIFLDRRGPLRLKDTIWVDTRGEHIDSYDKLHLDVKPGDYVLSFKSGGAPIGCLKPLDALSEEDYIPVYSDVDGFVLSSGGREIYRPEKGGLAYLAAVEVDDPRINRIYQEQLKKLWKLN